MIESEIHKFILPLSVTLPRKRKDDKKIMLNMNVYRNLHFQVNNQVKQYFQPIEISEFKAVMISISYFISKTTKRKFDTMNIISIVDKYFLDWLVENRYIPDDSCNNIHYGKIIGINDCAANRITAVVKIIL